jgi:hypothetical protein
VSRRVLDGFNLTMTTESESEFVNDLVTRYQALATSLIVKWGRGSVEALIDLRDSASYFDIPVVASLSLTKNHAWRSAFSELEQEVEGRHLSAAARQGIGNRLAQIVSDLIDRQREIQHKIEVISVVTKSLPDEELIRWYLIQLVAADTRLLEAGLAVLAKDAEVYLSKLAASKTDIESEALGLSAQPFQEVLAEIKAAGRRSAAGATFKDVEKDTTLPSGVAEEADRKGRADLSPLLNKRIIKKATLSVGRKFFRRFSERLKSNICGPKGLYPAVKKGQLAQAAVPTTLATTVLTTGFSAATLWYPLTVYLGLLIVRTGLDVYCQKDGSKTSSRREKANKMSKKK